MIKSSLSVCHPTLLVLALSRRNLHKPPAWKPVPQSLPFFTCFLPSHGNKERFLFTSSHERHRSDGQWKCDVTPRRSYNLISARVRSHTLHVSALECGSGWENPQRAPPVFTPNLQFLANPSFKLPPFGPNDWSRKFSSVQSYKFIPGSRPSLVYLTITSS